MHPYYTPTEEQSCQRMKNKQSSSRVRVKNWAVYRDQTGGLYVRARDCGLLSSFLASSV